MPGDDDTGKRLLANVIDSYAVNEPEKVWASIPIDDTDLSKGFREINYEEFANAVNTAAWWLAQNVSNAEIAFQTLAYSGNKDLRYPILAVAAVKCGKQLLLVSPSATPEAQRHLLRVTDCNVYLHAVPLKTTVQSIVGVESSTELLAVPELSEWLFAQKAHPFPYEKTWKDAFADPWLIFHTSGTTGEMIRSETQLIQWLIDSLGLPKPIVYTNWMMTSFDAAELMPNHDQETMNDLIRNSRCFVPVPPLHYVGMTVALQWTVFLNMVFVSVPSAITTAEVLSQVVKQGRASGAVLPPSLIEDLCCTAEGIKALQGLEYIFFVGAPLAAQTAHHLVGHCKVQPGMGSTESGAYFIRIRNEDDWEYYGFRPSMGVEFEQRTSDLFELVFRRKPELARWQQIFHLYPDLDEFPTRDLWIRHPSGQDLWRYVTRSDDLIPLSNGQKLWVSEIEAEIQRHPEVKISLIGGQGRPRPFILIELNDSLVSKQEWDKESKLEAIWPAIAKANKKCSDTVKLTKELVIFTHVEKQLPRTAKDTVPRRIAFSLYSSEIESLYRS